MQKLPWKLGFTRQRRNSMQKLPINAATALIPPGIQVLPDEPAEYQDGPKHDAKPREIRGARQREHLRSAAALASARPQSHPSAPHRLPSGPTSRRAASQELRKGTHLNPCALVETGPGPGGCGCPALPPRHLPAPTPAWSSWSRRPACGACCCACR